jgi:uncharacterized damage-inducible protein DinB
VAAAVALTVAMLAGSPLLADGEPGAAYERNLTFVGGRAVDLVEAMPADAMGWRPAEGVRSVSEAAMHMASANYFFAGQLGTPAPEGVDPGAMEAITDQAKVVATLRASLEHMGTAFLAVENPQKEMEIFGRPGTAEDMMMIAIGHVHEHLGQLIAYARSTDVTPPWSE